MNHCQKMLLLSILLTLLVALSCSQPPANRTTKQTVPIFTIQSSLFTGSAPWDYAVESGILERRSNQFGVKINFEQGDSTGIVENFIDGRTAGCYITNLEALNNPAAAGVDTTVVLIGDTSYGADRS